ncbi:DNA-(apurinic or apyrimidinic site) endonuclease 2 isoform X2 [Arachis hypogaea]|uniref:DNA-(apurinic or apyrimidinic site) endonuclease 2 isoform X2 n=1 Tax=Arachis hypogaea TaxID=3818 RepID=UPI003B2152AD
MKIVTYNVNGLRQRIAQFGSLRNLLNSFDADIICFQETKLRRQELTADLVMAHGYESFFSCSRSSQKGRTGYSGVITFCRVKLAFASGEVALPVSAEEGFTGLMGNSEACKVELPFLAEDIEEFSQDELLSVDSEGRCVITDHDHFVLFNVYGPRAGGDDEERIQFKQKFYQILQKRWESLLHMGRRIIVVGDLNIAPSAIDRCDAGPEFDNNEFRRWFRSILTQYKRAKPESILSAHRWKGGRSIKLEGSDHAPVFMTLVDIPDVSLHSTPSLSSRYVPMVHGLQQTIVSVLMKRQVSEGIEEPVEKTGLPAMFPCDNSNYPPSQGSEGSILEFNDTCGSSSQEAVSKSGSEYTKSITMQCNVSKKKARNQWSQLSLMSFFKKSSNIENGADDSCTDNSDNKTETSQPDPCELETQSVCDNSDSPKQCRLDTDACDQNLAKLTESSIKKEKSNMASLEWQRIHQLMQNSIPLCKGHKEPCVARVVKKQGPNCGRRFYVCSRAEGPSSNPEANCGYFKWAASKSRNEKSSH